jgi:2-phosphosulfolactate phosphatase
MKRGEWTRLSDGNRIVIVTVAMNARGVGRLDRTVCIVLDVLRASSTMLSMFEAGARELRLASTPEAALSFAAHDRDAYWVCGERHGLKVEGFDFGNSPVEFTDADLGERKVVYVTSNGTRALEAVKDAAAVLVGSPRNEVAVVRQAIREAHAHDSDILVLCAGDNGGVGVSLEDTFCAGMLVDRIVKLNPRRVTPEEPADPDLLALDDSAILVHRFFRSYLQRGDSGATSETILAMFAESRSGRDLPTKGLGADLEYCSEIDVTTVVPRLDVRGDTLVVVAQG